MGNDRLSEWMGKFGYGHYTGIDLAEEHFRQHAYPRMETETL